MKKIITFVLLFFLLGLTTTTAMAMIGGELDTEHTNVGAIVFRWPAYDDILARACTATLIHPQALVTAAHCTELLINGGVVPDKVWITFEPNALIGTPEENPDLYLEITEIIQHPEYKAGKEFNDISLILLTEPVEGIPLVDLPPENYMEDILQQPPRGKGKGDLDFIFVGYGATGPWELPYLHLDGERRVGTTSFVNLLPLVILVNNSSPEDAVICDGDSGGPIFHVVSPGTEVFVGLHSREGSSWIPCDGLGPSYKTRVDTANARDFITENLP